MASLESGTSGPDGQRDEVPDVRAFVESFALVLAAAGMQRMAARAFAALLASESGSLTAAELAALLQASPAAISGSVRYLESARMAQRGRRPGERTDHWMLGGDHWYETMATRVDIFDALRDALDQGVDAVPPGSAAAERLSEVRDFFAFLRAEMPKLIDRWRAER